MSEWIHLRTKNDTNGNPRRLYVEIQGGRIVAVADEGYKGTGAAHAAGMPKTYSPCSFDVTGEEYRVTKGITPWPRESETYQGYRNYETFSVDLSLSNDQEQYAKARQLVKDGGRTLDTDRALRAYVESLPGFVEVLDSGTLAGTLTNAALDAVDWRELVNLWADRIEEA